MPRTSVGASWVTALGAGQFTFEVVQRTTHGTPQARVPTFAHVGKVQPFEEGCDSGKGQSSIYVVKQTTRESAEPAVCPRGQNDDAC